MSTCASFCALTCPHVTNFTDMPSPGASLGTPGDRQHVDKQAFPGGLAPQYQGTNYIKTDKLSPGILFRMHQETDYIKTAGQAFPWDPFQGATGDRLHEDKRVFPWDPFQGAPGDRPHKDKGVFPWNLHQDTDHIKTKESSPGTLFRVHRGQITQRQAVLGHKYMYTLGSCQHLSNRDCLFLYIVANMWQSPCRGAGLWTQKVRYFSAVRAARKYGCMQP